MAKRWRESALLCLVLFAAACGQQQAAPTLTATPVPTLAVTTEVPTASPIVRATLPPSWTPAISWTPSITMTPSITLTPSKTLTLTPTPTLTATLTLTPTLTPNATNFALLSQPLAPACADFSADPTRNQRSFTVGTAPTVYWTSVDTAAAYTIRLYGANNATLLAQTTTDTEFTFDADLFQLAQNYAWDVSPLDADGVQLCPSRGALLVPTP